MSWDLHPSFHWKPSSSGHPDVGLGIPYVPTKSPWKVRYFRSCNFVTLLLVLVRIGTSSCATANQIYVHLIGQLARCVSVLSDNTAEFAVGVSTLIGISRTTLPHEESSLGIQVRFSVKCWNNTKGYSININY